MGELWECPEPQTYSKLCVVVVKGGARTSVVVSPIGFIMKIRSQNSGFLVSCVVIRGAVCVVVGERMCMVIGRLCVVMGVVCVVIRGLCVVIRGGLCVVIGVVCGYMVL